MPALLSTLCSYLGWTAAQHWALDADGKSMRVRYAWNGSGARADGFLHARRCIALAQESGVEGRTWQAVTVTAEVDLEQAVDYPLFAAARAAVLLSAVAPPVVAGGDVG